MANPGTVTNHSSALTALARLFARTFTRTNAYKAFGAYLLYVVIKYRNTAFGIRPRPDIDGPRGIPLLGNLVEFLKRPRTQNYQHQMRNHEIRFGSHYTVSLPGVGRIINITDPEMLDHVLRVNFWAYEKGSYLRNTLAPMVGQGVYLWMHVCVFFFFFFFFFTKLKRGVANSGIIFRPFCETPCLGGDL